MTTNSYRNVLFNEKPPTTKKREIYKPEVPKSINIKAPVPDEKPDKVLSNITFDDLGTKYVGGKPVRSGFLGKLEDKFEDWAEGVDMEKEQLVFDYEAEDEFFDVAPAFPYKQELEEYVKENRDPEAQMELDERMGLKRDFDQIKSESNEAQP